MNRNEQVNGEKMWEYISNIGKGMKKYGIKIGATAFSLSMLFTLGCAEAWQESYRELSKINDGPPAQQAPEVIVIRDHSLSDSTHELEMLNRQMALENSLRIRRMQLELKRREAERKLQEFNEK